jgi:hypothetical protein
MATAPTTIRPAPDQTETHRRRLALAIAAAVLVGGSVAAVAVNADHTAPAPVQHPAGGTLAPSDLDGLAFAAGMSSREYSARLRAERLSRARQPDVSSREYSARLRAERLSRAR